MKNFYHYFLTASTYFFAISFGMILTASIVYGKGIETTFGIVISALGVVLAGICHKQICTEETEE